MSRGRAERGSEKLAKEEEKEREREREGDAWTKSGSDGAAQWNGSTPAADANGQPTHWRYLGYSQCVCAGLTFLFIEQSRLSLSLSSLPLLSTPPLNLPFLPSSMDGFTLSPSLSPIFFHPLLQFARSAPIYSLIFILSSLLFLSSKLSILLYKCLSSIFICSRWMYSVLLARWSIILIICFKEIHFQSHFRKVNKSANFSIISFPSTFD